MAYAKNHTQKGRFSIQRERERGSRTRRTHFRLYNSYSMRFAQTRKQKSKKVKRNPLAPMTGTRGSHVERRKLHLCSAAHLSAAAVSDGSKVLVSTPHRLTRPSSMAPSSLYLLPSIMYYTTNRTFLQGFSQNQAHFVRSYASAATLWLSPRPWVPAATQFSEEMQFLSIFSVTQFPKVSVFPTFWEWDAPNSSTHLQFSLCLSCMEKAPAMWYN